jgi:REP element-mobilizing transposase RayT
MTKPRKSLVCVADTPYYHVMSRCVRRSFLCGKDSNTGRDFEHRRQWIVDRIRLLSSIFSIDVCSYSVMQNHYHIVLKIDADTAKSWNDTTVAERWLCLFKGPLLIQKFHRGETLSKAELLTVSEIINEWRERLANLSWFMKCLNQPIAKLANQEDHCTGHFWESRFKSQALLNEEALLTCMAYVDLNPIRAAIATTPETSDYTSIQERIQPRFSLTDAIKTNIELGGCERLSVPLKPLLPFDGNITQAHQAGISFHYPDYLELVDWTGRATREDKRGAIPSSTPPILERLNIKVTSWLNNSQRFEDQFHWYFSERSRCKKTA